MSWLDSTLADPVQAADIDLATVALKSLAVLAKTSPAMASTMGRSLPKILVQGGLDGRVALVAADCVASVLKNLPQDVIVTTLYSLGNVLSATGGLDRHLNGSPLNGSVGSTSRTRTPFGDATMGSTISLAPSDSEDRSDTYNTVIYTVVAIAVACQDEEITALVLDMLLQKIGKINSDVDAKIIMESGRLGVHGDANSLRGLLKLYGRLTHDGLIQDKPSLVEAVTKAMIQISSDVKVGTGLFEPYLLYMLSAVVSKGDAHDTDREYTADVELATQEIAQLLKPLATFVSANHDASEDDMDFEGLPAPQRDAWFNVVVHGFTLSSSIGRAYRTELQVLAKISHPLIAEDRAGQLESDIELNTILRRGKTSDNTNKYKRQLAALLPTCSDQIHSLSHSEVVFLTAANLVEELRASSGDCSKVLTYFVDPVFKSGAMGTCMHAIAIGAVKTYLSKTLSGTVEAFSSPYLAMQLAAIFTACCHRISRVQQVAIACADLIITSVPSALCHKSSVFALLELLTIMWSSCLEKEVDEYEWKSTYTSPRENVTVELSDNYAFREQTLAHFHKWAKTWIHRVLEIAPLDIKGLLQTYLSEYDDEGAYGHVSLGRSFALEMGSVIPATDSRLGSIENKGNLGINTASDFVAQYTTRQEYRLAESLRDSDGEWLRFGREADPLMRSRLDQSLGDATSVLAHLEMRTLSKVQVPIAELRDTLRRAGALLCRSSTDQCAIVHHLVGIPFAVFTRQAIKLGISLWMGVIKENPRMEARILVEVAEHWEGSVRQRKGFFNPNFRYVRINIGEGERLIL